MYFMHKLINSFNILKNNCQRGSNSYRFASLVKAVRFLHVLGTHTNNTFMSEAYPIYVDQTNFVAYKWRLFGLLSYNSVLTLAVEIKITIF